MAPIIPSEMGDVWPVVQPGRQNSDYGSATLSPTGPFEVRSFQTLTVTYTVGRFGLDDTGAICIAQRWVNDCGRMQVDDPTGANYVTATASNGVRLGLYAQPYSFRPWGHVIRVTVHGGYMREGDTITVAYGDRSGGGPGYRVQTISDPAFEFKVSVDACATGHFNDLPEPLSVPIVAGPPERWALIGPGLRRPGEAFSLGIKAEDSWGNPATPGALSLRLEADGAIEGLPAEFDFPEGERSMRIDGLRIADEGLRTLRLRDGDGTLLATSNPVVIRNADLAGYWGDLHGQSGETVGIGEITEYMHFARDLAFLDVSSHQANDFQVTNAFWDRINRISAEMNEDGRFTLFPGYEWSGNTPVGGDHNVFFRHEDRQIVRSSHAMLNDRSDLDTDANTLDALFDALRGEDCIIWSHVGGRPADISYAHDPALKTAVEVHSNWGTFEWILTDSLALGHRVGVVANSDGHKGRPGASPPGATEFGAYGGLTCFLAPELTRDALFECMRRRHHYGTSGSRIGLDVRASFDAPARVFTRDPRHFSVDGQPVEQVMMGDIVETDGQIARLSVRVDAPAAIERIDVLHGADEVHTHRTYAQADLGRRVRVYWQGAEYRGRGRNTRWLGEIAVSGGQIQRMEPINRWNPERPLEVIDQASVRFDAVTSGNYGGVDLLLDSDAAHISVETNLVSGETPLDALGLDDTVLDAGGLERRIVLRRLPDDLTATSAAFEIDVDLLEGAENPLWVRVTTLDGHQAWSSPIYASRGSARG